MDHPTTDQPPTGNGASSDGEPQLNDPLFDRCSPTTDNLEAYGKAVAATQEPILPEYGTLNPPSSPAEKEAVDGVRWKCLKLVDGTDSDPYAVRIGGVLADPARIARAYGINDGMLFSALKKILRSGRKHKAKATDIREAITSLERWEAMNREDQKQ